MMRDTWRAVLVLVVVTAVRHDAALWSGFLRAIEPPATPSSETVAVVQPPQQTWAAAMPVAPVAPVQGNGYHWPSQAPVVQPQQIVVRQEQERPLRRVAAALTEVGDSLIGVVR